MFELYSILGNNTLLPIAFLMLALNALYNVITTGKKVKNLAIWAIALLLVSYSPEYTTHEPKSSAVLVTGASTGIGHKVAIELSNLGYTVFATVRKESDFSKFPKSADKVIPIIMDTTNAETIKEARKKIEESKIPLVGLVQNAAIAYGAFITDLVPEEECKWVMEVNYWGSRRVVGEFLPLIRKAKGRVLLSSSIVGWATPPMADCYPMTKRALNSYAHLLRQQEKALNSGVSVSVLAIGSVRTSMQDKATESIGDQTQCEADQSRLESPSSKTFWKSYCPTRITTLEFFTSQASPVEVVVPAHLHALSNRRPLTEYAFGVDALFLLSLNNILPDHIMDSFWFLATQLNQHIPK